jgi:hypothetical protein
MIKLQKKASVCTYNIVYVYISLFSFLAHQLIISFYDCDDQLTSRNLSLVVAFDIHSELDLSNLIRSAGRRLGKDRLGRSRRRH